MKENFSGVDEENGNDVTELSSQIEIKNKLTITRGERGRDNRGWGKEKGHQRTCIEDTWTKPKVGRREGGRWGWMGEGSGEGKMETTVLE